jgi:hypothetical protein
MDPLQGTDQLHAMDLFHNRTIAAIDQLHMKKMNQ